MLSSKHISGLGLTLIASLVFSTSVFASSPGIYLGGQLGYGYVHEGGISIGDMGAMINDALGHGDFTRDNFDGATGEAGFAWRVFGGYQIGYNWAMEIGWSHFPRVPVDASMTGIDFDNGGVPYLAGTSGTFQVNAFDAVGKYIFYPMRCFCQMYMYGKLGVAYVVGRANMAVNVNEPVPEPGLIATVDDQDITNWLYPTFGLGVGYDFRPDITMDLSYSRIQKVGGSEQLGSIDVVMLAMALHFG